MNPVTLLTGRRRYGLEFLGDGHSPSVFGGCVDPSPEKSTVSHKEMLQIQKYKLRTGQLLEP